MEFAHIMKKKNSFFSIPVPRVLLIVCMAVLAIASPNSAQAQEWRFEPIVSVGGEFDDNARLGTRTDEEVELSGLLLDLKADIRYSSATTSFFVQPRVLSRNYNVKSDVELDETVYDSDDFFLQSQFSHTGKSNTIGFRGTFDEQEVRTAERAISDLEIVDPDEFTDDDTGRIVLTGTRSKWRISPYWEYQLSNTSSIGANLDYFDVQYEDVFAGLLSDYSDARLNLNYRRSFSNVNSALLTMTARTYDVVDTTNDITGYGLMAGFEHALSEKTTLTAMFGFEDTQQTGVEYDPEVVGYITLIRNLETIRMFAQYRRSVNASGAGLDVRNSLNLNFRRRLSEKISAGLGVRAYQSSGVGSSAFIEDRNYVQLQSTFLWYLSRAFVIEASYRYTVNDRGVEIGGRSNSNQINLWFTYQPRTIPKI